MQIWVPLLASVALGFGAQSNADERAGIAPARLGDIAILEELEAARACRCRQRYELFLRRHPRHKLAGPARAELEALLARKPRGDH